MGPRSVSSGVPASFPGNCRLFRNDFINSPSTPTHAGPKPSSYILQVLAVALPWSSNPNKHCIAETHIASCRWSQWTATLQHHNGRPPRPVARARSSLWRCGKSSPVRDPMLPERSQVRRSMSLVQTVRRIQSALRSAEQASKAMDEPCHPCPRQQTPKPQRRDPIDSRFPFRYNHRISAAR